MSLCVSVAFAMITPGNSLPPTVAEEWQVLRLIVSPPICRLKPVRLASVLGKLMGRRVDCAARFSRSFLKPAEVCQYHFRAPLFASFSSILMKQRVRRVYSRVRY